MNLWVLAGVFLFGLAASLSLQLHIHQRLESDLDWRTRSLNERIEMSTQSAIDAIVAQLRKAKDEIVTKLETATTGVQAQLVEAGVEDQVDLSALIAITQQLDDIVPDITVDPEVDEAEEGDEVEFVDETETLGESLDSEEVEVAEVAVDEVEVAVDEADDK